MTISTTHLHAAMDRYPHFLSTIRAEFPDDCERIADEMIDAELGDFCWEARIAERQLYVIDACDDGEDEKREAVCVLGYFRGQYLVATCIVDDGRRLQWMPKVRHFDDLADAETAFLAAE